MCVSVCDCSPFEHLSEQVALWLFSCPLLGVTWVMKNIHQNLGHCDLKKNQVRRNQTNTKKAFYSS